MRRTAETAGVARGPNAADCALDETSGDEPEDVPIAEPTRRAPGDESDSEDEVPIAELMRRAPGADDDGSESGGGDGGGGGDDDDDSESDEEDAPPRKRPRTAAAQPRAAWATKYYGEAAAQKEVAIAASTRAPAGVRRARSKFEASYRDRDRQNQSIGKFATEEEAAHAYNAALAKHGLESIRKVNKVDKTGRLVAKPERVSVSARPDVPEADRTCKYHGALQCEKKSRPRRRRDFPAGVTYLERTKRFQGRYNDGARKKKTCGYFPTQVEAARAREAAIKRFGLESMNKMNTNAAGVLVEKP